MADKQARVFLSPLNFVLMANKANINNNIFNTQVKTALIQRMIHHNHLKHDYSILRNVKPWSQVKNVFNITKLKIRTIVARFNNWSSLTLNLLYIFSMLFPICNPMWITAISHFLGNWFASWTWTHHARSWS